MITLDVYSTGLVVCLSTTPVSLPIALLLFRLDQTKFTKTMFLSTGTAVVVIQLHTSWASTMAVWVEEARQTWVQCPLMVALIQLFLQTHLEHVRFDGSDPVHFNTSNQFSPLDMSHIQG
ncbi:hypothetical protein BS17DRAFT_239362 [Gyrodon lividus]|nr:hypothetical protein BS17DRAFT_239362 [Gyrodon lividus]